MLEYSVTIDELTIQRKYNKLSFCYKGEYYRYYEERELSRELTDTIYEDKNGVFEQSGKVRFTRRDGSEFTVDFQELPNISNPVEYLKAIWTRVYKVRYLSSQVRGE